MSNFWNEDGQNESSFRDGPEEESEAPHFPQPQNPIRSRTPAPEVDPIQELVEELSEEEPEDDFQAILQDANLRIEQGTLYKMIMNSDLFSEMDVDKRAIDNVQKEIRKFAKERMEIMLGMRREVQKESIVSSPFNDLEVEALKMLASKMTKGASESKSVQPKSVPVQEKPAKKNTLTPIRKQETTPVKASLAPTKKSAPLAKSQPMVRHSRPAETIEEAIRESLKDDGYDPLSKKAYELTEEEKIQRNKDSSIRQSLMKSVKSSTSLPPPSVDQMNMMNQMRASDLVGNSGLAKLVNLAKSK